MDGCPGSVRPLNRARLREEDDLEREDLELEELEFLELEDEEAWGSSLGRE